MANLKSRPRVVCSCELCGRKMRSYLDYRRCGECRRRPADAVNTARKTYPHPRLADAACVECGAAMKSYIAKPMCRGCRRRRRDQCGPAPTEPISCDWCGARFVPYRPNNIYCNRLCKSKAKDAKRGHHNRRTRAFGGTYVPVDKRTIYERDDWRCGICGKRVDRRLAFPHLMSASVDHIVPLSDGGDHVPSNLQCAHWICNVRKGGRGGGEQLAMF